MRFSRGRSASIPRSTSVHRRNRLLGIRSVERLESRCVLNGDPMTAMLFGPSLANKTDSDNSAAAFSSQSSTSDLAKAGATKEAGFYQTSNFFDSGFGRGNFSRGEQSFAAQSNSWGWGYGQSSFNSPSQTLFGYQPVGGYGTTIVFISYGSTDGDNAVANFAPAAPPKPNIAISTHPDLNFAQFAAISVVASSSDESADGVARSAAQLNLESTASSSSIRAAYATPIVGGNQTYLVAAHGATLSADDLIAQTVPPIVNQLRLPQILSNGTHQAVTKIIAANTLVKAASMHSAQPIAAIGAPIAKSALLGLPLNVHGVEQAVEKVMSEIGQIGTNVTSWLDDMHLTPVVVAAVATTLGAGSVYYLKRRGGKAGDQRDDEASSSWLFARLQSTVSHE